MTSALRLAAIVIALAGVIDPAFTLSRPQPLPIDVRLPASNSPRHAEAAAVRARLFEAVGPGVTPANGAAPGAVILVGGATADDVPLDVPVSAIRLVASRPDVRVVRVDTPRTLLAGQSAVVVAHLEGRGVRGRTTTIALEHEGVAFAEVTHTWSEDEGRAAVRVEFAPPRAGVFPLRLTARPLDDEEMTADNVADVAVVAGTRRLRVLAYEPRPSWAAAFVRRALEAEPAFEVASLVTVSRAVDARAGVTPSAFTAAALEPYDAVLVAAPESLTANDVAALDAFARVRGGTVILLPDQRPSGAFLTLVAARGFDEVLVPNPIALGGAGPRFAASEFALPREPGPGAFVLGTIQHGGKESAAVVAWPRGAGRVVFSGALDAWRYRARDDAAFARFWTTTIAGFASAAPPRVAIEVYPAVTSPGASVAVRVTVRATEFEQKAAATVVPPVSATLIDERGTEQPIRLWPASEAGVFHGRIVAESIGRYTVRAGATDAPLVVADEVRVAAGEGDETKTGVARMTGGVRAVSEDLDPIVRHLAALPRPEMAVSVRPARSVWWLWAFAALVCSEWAVRRTRGLR
jgi:hypothetical protein